MVFLSRRALAPQISGLLWAAALFALPAGPDFAQSTAPPLSQAEAERIALERQPLLMAQGAAVAAAIQDADAASSLPDPMLTTGVTDLPVDGDARFSSQRDDFTMFTIGVEQDFPLGSKRELRGRKAQLMADHAQHQLDIATRTVAREAKLAWTDAWQAQQDLALAESALKEVESARQAADISYRTGRASQSDLLAAGVAVELLGDEIAGLKASAEKARPMLGRWIGEPDAARPLAEGVPDAAVPPVETLLAALSRHPDLASAVLGQDLADADVALAKADRWPDWGIGVEYGYRPLFPDYVSLNLRIGLPLFPAHRQHSRIAAAGAQARGAQDNLEDTQRRLVAEIRAGFAEWKGLQERLGRFDGAILPQTQAGALAAQAAYGAGSGSLSNVLNARQAALMAQRTRVRLAADMTRAAARLAYYAPEAQP